MYFNYLSYFFIFILVFGQILRLPFLNQEVLILDVAIAFFNVTSLLHFRKISFERNYILLFGFVFYFIGLISLSLTPLRLSIQEFITSALYGIRFINYLFFGYILICNKKLFIKLNPHRILLISMRLIALLGILQLILFPDLRSLAQYGWDPHYFRIVSTFLDPNFLGGFLVLGFLLEIRNFSDSNFKSSNIFFIALLFVAILGTFSRSAWLNFSLAFLFFIIFSKSKRLLMLWFVCVLLFLFSFYLYTIKVSEPRGISRVQSASYRIDSWNQGIEIFKRSPILGVGFNSYKYALLQYGLIPSTLQSHGITTNDSSFLYVLATTGLVGFGIYLAFLAPMLFYGLKRKNLHSLIFSSWVIGLIIQSFFVNNLFFPQILFALILQFSNINNIS